MNYEEFKNEVQANILNYLPEEYKNYTVYVNQQLKNNNVVLDGLFINDDGKVAPMIYLNDFYEQYKQGVKLEDILRKIADIRVNKNIESESDYLWIVDYEKAKEHLVCRIVNRDDNLELLEKVPHKIVEDLAVTYHVIVANINGLDGNVRVTNEILEMYGISQEELHEQALENMRKINPPIFVPLRKMIVEMLEKRLEKLKEQAEEGQDIIESLFEDADRSKLYVLTNRGKIDGAAAILDQEIMKEISKEVGGNFYIIPSSIHEVLIMPVDCMDYESLEEIIKDVNNTQVSQEEKLSDYAYEYDVNEGQIHRADKMCKC